MTNKQVRRQVGRVLTKYEPKKDSWPALLGNGRGTVSVAGRPGWVYVRTGSDELPGQAFNNRVPLHDDLPIIVGYDSLQPELFQVLTIREVYAGAGSGDNAIPQVVAHHGTHEFGADEGGSDVVWVQKQQIVPMLATPTSPNTMMINVYADLYPWGTGWNWFAGALSADLTARIAAAAGEAKYVLVSIDGATNTLQYTNGTDFIILLPPADMGDLIPEPPAGSVPVVAVYLPNGVTSLGWDNLFDVRLFNQPMGGSVAPGVHQWLDATAHDDTVTNAPVQGAMGVGNATPAWDILLAGTAHQLLKMNAGATDPAWASFNWAAVAAAAAADMVHDHSAAGEGGLLSQYLSLSGPIHLDYITGVMTEYATIQLALNACAINDVVLVPPGAYTENLTWPAVQRVTLVSCPTTDGPAIITPPTVTITGTLSTTQYGIIRGIYITGNITMNGALAALVLENSRCGTHVLDGGTAGDLTLINSFVSGYVDVNNLNIMDGWVAGARTVAGATTYYGEVKWAETVGDHAHDGVAGDGGQISHDSALTDVSADDHHNEDHAARHKDGGADELDVSELAGALGAAGTIPETDGAAVSWVDPNERYDPPDHLHAGVAGDGGVLRVEKLLWIGW